MRKKPGTVGTQEKGCWCQMSYKRGASVPSGTVAEGRGTVGKAARSEIGNQNDESITKSENQMTKKAANVGSRNDESSNARFTRAGEFGTFDKLTAGRLTTGERSYPLGHAAGFQDEVSSEKGICAVRKKAAPLEPLAKNAGVLGSFPRSARCASCAPCEMSEVF